MIDSANEAASELQKPGPRWGRWAFGVVALLLIALVCFLTYGQPSASAVWTLNRIHASHLFQALKLFAGDHGGNYPRSLSELEPQYPSMVENTRYRDGEAHRRYDWFYLQGLSLNSPANWIVLASPTDQTSEDRDIHERIVVYNDGRAAFVPPDEFSRQLADQVKAMAAKAP